MGNFIPIFDGAVSASKKNFYDERFKIAYNNNKTYFDQFPDTIEVHFNSDYIPFIKLLGNFKHDEVSSHIEKIKGILNKM